LATWKPTRSPWKWSTATKTHTFPSLTVSTVAPSVAHILSGASVTMVPSCAFASPRGRRWGDSSEFSRIRRSTRLRDVRTFCSRVSRAQTGR
jgi:hypothetical protein